MTMIKNAEHLHEREKAQRREPVDVVHNRKHFEGLYRLARNLGALGPEEDSLNHKIALARALNVRVAARAASLRRSKPKGSAACSSADRLCCCTGNRD